jgi:hypothetical protein
MRLERGHQELLCHLMVSRWAGRGKLNSKNPRIYLQPYDPSFNDIPDPDVFIASAKKGGLLEICKIE